MTIRRINSTGRERIKRADTNIRIIKNPSGPATFHAILNLSNYNLPYNAKVFVEAHRRSTLMRFPFGTVAEPHPPTTPELSRFIDTRGVLFRVKVVDFQTQKGLLLAEGDIPVSNDKERPDNRVALLPPRPENIGHEIWRVDFSGSPELLINEKLPDWKATAQSTEFRSLVFPVAARLVLERIFWSNDRPEIGDESGWAFDWIRFAESLPGVTKHPPLKKTNEDEWLDWVDSVCERFAANFQLLDKYAGEGVDP